VTLEGYEALPGTLLEPGSIVIKATESSELDKVLGHAWPIPRRLHPLHAYIAAQRGIGTSVKQLCDLADFDIDDGPMMGTLEIEIAAPLVAGARYMVTGEILDLVRKTRRSGGVFDLLTYREQLTADSGAVVATITNSFVLIRRAV
jgi:hypothetical protein